jgi:hypothetical protein
MFPNEEESVLKRGLYGPHFSELKKILYSLEEVLVQ